MNDDMIDLDREDELREIKRIVLENNKILKGIQSRTRFAFVARIFYWLIVIGIAVGAFYYVQPYIGEMVTLYENVKETQKTSAQIFNNFNIDGLREYFKKEE